MAKKFKTGFNVKGGQAAKTKFNAAAAAKTKAGQRGAKGKGGGGGG